MAKILVSGLINIETTVRVESFPIIYTPVRYPFFGVNSAVSGVGYNIARALTILGDDVRLLSLIGRDPLAALVQAALERDQIAGENVLDTLDQTAQSVILFDGEGRRQINVDLKNIQETPFPHQRYAKAASGCDLLVLCNINFSRPFLEQARKSGKRVASDVHAISELNDPYNGDFMRTAHILFMSHEWLPVRPEEWARRVWDRYGPEILVISMGGEGALLAVKKDNFIERIPIVRTRPLVNTIGAGDALFSAFLHTYAATEDPYLSLRKA
ncbi:MAG: carbohydrate kinase family protein, partial [Anaerolineaceae bacterium]|nr:carbohydrate kinase family protein [Anaerolineaceae bacterium]